MDHIIGGFDPNLGISVLRDGTMEVGRTNLPETAKLIPESDMPGAMGLVFGRTADSSLLERFGSYLAPAIANREILAPDVFFEVLEAAAEDLVREAGERGDGADSPLPRAALLLADVLADRHLCEMLRNLVVRA